MDLYDVHLQLIQISNNNLKTKKKMIKIYIKKTENYYPIYAKIRFVTLKKFQID